MVQITPWQYQHLLVMRTAASLLWLDESSLWVRGCLKVLQMPNECRVMAIEICLHLHNHSFTIGKENLLYCCQF